MIRTIIEIDRDKCNGCGACAHACHEGAIGMVDGKAVLLRDDYCDGLGDCLPACPTGAIRFVQREAAAYDAAAVLAKKAAALKGSVPVQGGGCPGSRSQILHPAQAPAISTEDTSGPVSALSQWPVQLKLLPVEAPFYDGMPPCWWQQTVPPSPARTSTPALWRAGLPPSAAPSWTRETIRKNSRKFCRRKPSGMYWCPHGGPLLRRLTGLSGPLWPSAGKDLPLQVITLGRDGHILEA